MRGSLKVREPRGITADTTLTDDKELALAFQRGEQNAYGAIYDRYSARVEAICRRMLRDPHDAEEAMQESLLRVYQGLVRFNGRYQLGAWIARVTTNVCLDQLRARQRRPSDMAPLEDLEWELSDGEPATDPETFVLKRSEGRRVRKVLDSLPPLHRAAIVLRDFEGLSYTEVASALDITECQVKALLHRARKNFRSSWTSLAGLFFPVRLLQRLRKVEQPSEGAFQMARAGQHLGDVATSASSAASTCSVVLQQCGQFVGERFAAVATTVVVGAAAVGGGAVAPAPQPHEPVSARVVAGADAADPVADGSERPKEKRAAETADDRSETSETGGEAPSSVTPQPAPSPSPTPTSAPSGGQGTGSNTSSGGAQPPPTSGSQKPVTPVYDFKPAVGFDTGTPVPATSSKDFSLDLDCATRSLDQYFTTTLWNDSVGYDAQVWFRAGPTDGGLQIAFTKDGKRYHYSSWGRQPTATWVVEGDRLALEVTGEYGPLYDSAPPEDAELPRSGAFSAKVALDCAASAVVTQGVTLQVQ